MMYIGFTARDLEIILEAVDERIFMLAHDRFNCEQANDFKTADAITKKLYDERRILRRLKYIQKHLNSSHRIK